MGPDGRNPSREAISPGRHEFLNDWDTTCLKVEDLGHQISCAENVPDAV